MGAATHDLCSRSSTNLDCECGGSEAFGKSTALCPRGSSNFRRKYQSTISWTWHTTCLNSKPRKALEHGKVNRQPENSALHCLQPSHQSSIGTDVTQHE